MLAAKRSVVNAADEYMQVTKHRSEGQQWRIQDFLDRGHQHAKGGGEGAPNYYLEKCFPKTAWKWKKLNRGRRPWCRPFDP